MSTLPDLPKRNKKKEADFGLKFRMFLMSHHEITIGPYELKHTRGKDYLNFSEVTQNQIDFALSSKTSKGVLVRVSLGTIGASDYILLRNCQYACIVIQYPSGFVFIDIDVWVKEKQTSKRKSLTHERAKVIANVVI